MSVSVASEFGPKQLLQQSSTVKWRIRIDDNFFVYLGAPRSVRSANASQAEVAPIVSLLKQTCSGIIRDVEKLSRVKLYYEKYYGFSFAHPIPCDVAVHVERSAIDRKLKPDEVPSSVRDLYTLMVRNLPQYDMTLRRTRRELFGEVASADWDARDNRFDSRRASWDTTWKSNIWEGQNVIQIEDFDHTGPQPDSTDGFISLTDCSTGEVSRGALYFSSIEKLCDTKHPEFAVCIFMRSDQASVIAFSLNGEIVCVDVRCDSATWVRYARDLKISTHFMDFKGQKIVITGLPYSREDESLAKWKFEHLRGMTLRRNAEDAYMMFAMGMMMSPVIILHGTLMALEFGGKKLIKMAKR